MNTTLAYLRGRRAWLVENLSIWGSDTEAEFLLALAEPAGSDMRVGFWPVPLGGQTQEVPFASLVDNRGNSLPASIKKPAVIVMPRGKRSAFVRTVLGESGFTIARSDNQTPPVTVDLMIFETGL